MLSDEKIILNKALNTRGEITITSSIELKHQKLQQKEIKKEIQTVTDLVHLEDLQSNLSETGAKVKDLESLVQASKVTVQRLRKTISCIRRISQTSKKGCNVNSIMVQIECIRKYCNVEVEAYHSGQFN